MSQTFFFRNNRNQKVEIRAKHLIQILKIYLKDSIKRYRATISHT